MKPLTLAGRLPWSIVLATFLLMAAGCIAIDRAETLAEASGHFARQQMVWGVLAETMDRGGGRQG